MKSIHPFIKNTVPFLLLFSAWSYTAEDELMYYPEHMPHESNNPHSPDYSPEFGRCLACDSELIPKGDRLEPELVCINPDCPDNEEEE
ncbi:exported hypothetical protein [Alteromonas alvinellae]